MKKRLLVALAVCVVTTISCSAATRTKWFGHRLIFTGEKTHRLEQRIVPENSADASAAQKTDKPKKNGKDKTGPLLAKDGVSAGPALEDAIDYLKENCPGTPIILDNPELGEIHIGRTTPPATPACKTADGLKALLDDQVIVKETMETVVPADGSGIHIQKKGQALAAAQPTPAPTTAPTPVVTAAPPPPAPAAPTPAPIAAGVLARSNPVERPPTPAQAPPPLAPPAPSQLAPTSPDVFAQKGETIVVPAPGQSVNSILAEMSAKYGFAVKYNGTLDRTPFIGEIPHVSVGGQVDRLVAAAHGSALRNGDFLTVYGGGRVPTVAELQIPPPAPPAPPSREQPLQVPAPPRAALPRSPAATPGTVEVPHGTPAYIEPEPLPIAPPVRYAQRVQRYRPAMVATPAVYRYPRVYTPNDAARAALANPNLSMREAHEALGELEDSYVGVYDRRIGRSNDDYMYDPIGGSWVLRLKGAATHGYLKLYAVGDSTFAQHLIIKRRDENGVWRVVGAGGKSYRFFHDPMELPIGKQRLRFEERRGGETLRFEEDFEIESKFDRNTPLEYPISADMLESVEKVREVKQPQ